MSCGFTVPLPFYTERNSLCNSGTVASTAVPRSDDSSPTSWTAFLPNMLHYLCFTELTVPLAYRWGPRLVKIRHKVHETHRDVRYIAFLSYIKTVIFSFDETNRSYSFNLDPVLN